jgi:hypothetical protein
MGRFRVGRSVMGRFVCASKIMSVVGHIFTDITGVFLDTLNGQISVIEPCVPTD